jgi:hypothetical protein
MQIITPCFSTLIGVFRMRRTARVSFELMMVVVVIFFLKVVFLMVSLIFGATRIGSRPASAEKITRPTSSRSSKIKSPGIISLSLYFYTGHALDSILPKTLSPSPDEEAVILPEISIEQRLEEANVSLFELSLELQSSIQNQQSLRKQLDESEDHGYLLLLDLAAYKETEKLLKENLHESETKTETAVEELKSTRNRVLDLEKELNLAENRITALITDVKNNDDDVLRLKSKINDHEKNIENLKFYCSC